MSVPYSVFACGNLPYATKIMVQLDLSVFQRGGVKFRYVSQAFTEYKQGVLI